MTADTPRLELAAPRLGFPRILTRGAVAKAITEVAVKPMPVRMRYPDGTVVGNGGPDSPVIEVVRPRAMFRRLEAHPKIGLGEAYMAGDWKAAEGTDLAQALMPFAARMGELVPKPLLALRGVVDRAIPQAMRNTLEGSRSNISAHYDLSNDLFAAFLDPSMSYSSALFDPARPLAEQDLHEAQVRKVEAILDAADVRAGSRVLEIGTGWGELALRAAARGATVTSVTLSAEQRALAMQRIEAAGVSDRVTVLLQDYRETTGQFDSIVSVEMIEAVGEEYWATYFRKIDELLAPGGAVAVQAILMEHHRLLATKHSFGWIQKYIFPGGLIPSLQAIRDVSRDSTTLRVERVHGFGADYAETLHRWRETFNANWSEIQQHGFDETFRRMWDFYLAYCEAGFATGYLDVAQIRLARR
ncbi:SAM-dependent methyltransferase [Phycicoccus duodecadis]|uniref:Cyclopropane-fatty-acyl-phospholipid synthase n=1 Tax=Phycicoccus duodecadis TaxID=173053 RepID=A0A2N3YIP9_9MICO|nr:cyclopropane-fatty-acyl-phospholipid synthase family protein [Phycicoccus duodecadis]PKW26727.1 cyclopropane-fatty-acyl-phospholipid synthase [Phycicoccus duodecadis]